MGNYIISIIFRLWLLGLWLWIIVIPVYLQKEGVDNFPIKENIVYSDGILKTTKRRINHHHTVIDIDIDIDIDIVIVPVGNKMGITYYCDYTAQHKARLSSCFSEEHITPYLNKNVRVGWYKKDDVLWFYNPYPQLVSLEVDGKVIRSYEESLVLAKNRIGTFLKILFSFITIAWGIVYICISIIGRRSLKEYRNKSKTNEV